MASRKRGREAEEFLSNLNKKERSDGIEGSGSSGVYFVYNIWRRGTAEAKKKVLSESKGEASASKVDDAKAATNVKVVNFKNSGFQYHLKPLEGQS